MSPFGDLLRQRRKDCGFKQQELSDEIGVPQSTISAWECGRQLPGRQRLPIIAQALDTSLKYLRDVYDTEVIQEELQSSPEKLFLREQQRYLERLKLQNSEIWFLAPIGLPVVGSEDVKKIWKQNLAAGAAYCILWVLDFVEEEVFQEIAPSLFHVSKDRTLTDDVTLGAPVSGVINHFGLIIDKNQTPHSLEALRRLEEEAQDICLFHGVIEANASLKPLLAYFNPLATVTLYKHHRRSLRNPPLAAITIREGRQIIEAPTNRKFIFLGDKESREIERSVRSYLKCLQLNIESINNKDQ